MDKNKLISLLQNHTEQGRKDLEDFIANEPVFKFLEKDGLEFPGIKMSFSRNDLVLVVTSLLAHADIMGAEKTAEDIIKFINSQEIPGLIILAVNGISVDAPIDINENIKLIPYKDIPDSFYKAIYDPFSVDDNFTLPIFPRELRIKKENPLTRSMLGERIKPTAALVYPVSTPKFQSFQFNYAKIYEDLKNLCYCLTLIGPSAPTPMALWWQPESWLYCWPNCFGAVIPENFDLTNNTNYSFKSNEIREMVIETCTTFLSLDSFQQKKILTPLFRLNKAILRRNNEDKAIELGIAIESLFINDDAKNELTYKLKLRAAWLLGKNAHDRYQLLRLFHDLYELRSKAVHGVEFTNTLKKRIEEGIFNKGISKTAEAIKYILVYKIKNIKNVRDDKEWKEFWDNITISN